MRFNVVGWLWLFTFTAVSFGYGQFGSSSHTVTLQVAAISDLQVSAGSLNLNITASNSIAGQDQMTVTDQSSTLMWGTNSGTQKITAASDLAAPKYTLKLVALSPTVGTAASEATLNNTPKDLMLDIGRSQGSCILQYTGVPLASQGTGSDVHTITFTVQTQ